MVDASAWLGALLLGGGAMLGQPLRISKDSSELAEKRAKRAKGFMRVVRVEEGGGVGERL